MRFENINTENLNELDAYIDSDVSENLFRAYYRGIAGYDSDETPKAVIVWEYRDVESSDSTSCEIRQLFSDDLESGQNIIEEYEKEIKPWFVQKSIYESNKDKSVEKVLKESGFDISNEESKDLYITLRDLGRIKVLTKSPEDYVESLDILGKREYMKAIINCMYLHCQGEAEDLAKLPPYWFDGTISCCIRSSDGINGMFLVHRMPSGTLMPYVFYASGADASLCLLNMLRFAVTSAIRMYPPDTKVLIRRRTDKTIRLTKKLMPNKKGETINKAERDECF